MRFISNILPSKQVLYFHEILLSHLLPCQCCGFSSERAADHWPGEAEPAIELSVKLRFGKSFYQFCSVMNAWLTGLKYNQK